MQKSILRSVFKKIQGESFAVTYWDGESEIYGTEEREPAFSLIIREKLDLKAMLSNPEVHVGEAYMENKIQIKGELCNVFDMFIRHAGLLKSRVDEQSLLQNFLKRQKNTSQCKQAEDVQYHYDLGNDFFRLWLDETMSYSCAYFRSTEDSLKQAQLQKIDHILRKLQLKEGETLLDIGSGWGWLIIRAAKMYGVKALGITLSKEQEKETSRRIKEEGLHNLVEVRLRDFRELAGEGHTFDKIVSVGMFEHVGKENIPEYFSCIEKMLKPQGLSLLHTITHPMESPTNPWLEKYIFPWGYIPSLREVVWELPKYSFNLIDLESLRLHYAMTTERWAENFEKVADQVEEKYGEKFVRMWRLYLVGCTSSFRNSGLDIHQLLFSRGLNNELPLTRDYLYKN